MVVCVSFQQAEFSLGEWIVNPLHCVITKGGEQIKVENRLMKVLTLLADEPEKGMSKNDLLSGAWSDKIASDETLSVAISQLRKLLGCNAKHPIYIKTITGYGYKLLVHAELLASTPVKSSITPSKGVQFLNKAKRTYLVTALVVSFISMAILVVSLQSPKMSQTELLENESYTKALFLMQQELDSVKQAEKLLIHLDKQSPENPIILTALGKALLFQCNHLSGIEKTQALTRSKDYLNQAIALDPQFGDAYLQLAIIYFWHEQDLNLAEEYFLLSIAHDPNQVISHIQYSILLTVQRKFDEAIHHYRIAQTIDPNYYSSPLLQSIYYMAGDLASAQKELAKLYTINPDSQEYHSLALWLYEALGDEKRAFSYYLKKFDLAGYSKKEMAEATNIFNLSGLKGLNHWLVNIKNEQKDVGQYLPPFSTARYYIASGENEKAIEVLEQAFKNKEPDIIWLNADPKYAPLKAYPRFQHLLNQIISAK